MRALFHLTIANIRSFLRDRAGVFWTFAFPLIFIVMFGSIFSGGGDPTRTYGWVDLDESARSTELRSAFAAVPDVELVEADQDDALSQMRAGDLRAVLVVPEGYGSAIDGLAAEPGDPTSIAVYTDPTQTNATADTFRIVDGVLDGISLAISGRGPAVVPEPRALQTQQFSFVSYIVPSILGMALMQLGVFSAIPLVADREKLILKRLNATPLQRWQLVGSNVAMRLLVAIVQTVIIVGLGVVLFDVEIAGSLLLIGAFVMLGAVTFISLGYVIASFARTEESANGMTSVVQFPLMFLSGTFFPIEQMPDVLQGVARRMPLTYLGDALRQTMVGGSAFAPLWVCAAVLAAVLALSLFVSARFFRWQ